MKKYLPDLLVVLLYAALSFAYFFPADTEGRILFQHDSQAGVGAGQEAKAYREQTGEVTRWTNGLFGGMPTYQISPSYDSARTLSWVEQLYRLYLPPYVQLTFILMLGFFILLRAFGVPVWLSGLGGVVWAFSSYFFIIIAAGHIWKFITLAYIPPTIAGMVLAYRGRLLPGALLTALFTALQIMSNHVQMSYYFLFVMLFMVVAYGVDAYRNRTLPRFFRATAVLIAAGIVGISINLSNLYHTYTYSKETMRGKSELVETGHAAAQSSSGLDRDYITQWSYGIGETLTLFIPDYKGGASVPLSQSAVAMSKANPLYAPLYNQLPQYFGDQPGTSGPVYVGAFVFFLFLMGCFLVKGPMKWALLGATLFSILLSWGHNLMPLTDLFIDYVPLYNKFRAVSSILVIAEFTIPLLAMLGLWQLISEPKRWKNARQAVGFSTLITIGIAAVLYVVPSAFGNEFVPAAESNMLHNAVAQGGIPAAELSGILDNLAQMRAALVTHDAGRTILIVAVGIAILMLNASGKLRREWTLAAIFVLCLADMWGVNKRYLNDSQFVAPAIRTESFTLTDADRLILQDTLPDYRVLNLATNTFNENTTSYHHKSIGGYHAAKLRRYQELIEHHISPEIQTLARAGGNLARVPAAQIGVLNMLNTRYVILPTQDGGTTAVRNPHAYGNAWYVRDVNYVPDANSEIDALSNVALDETAVVDVRFRHALHGDSLTPRRAADATVSLTAYRPNHLTYTTSASSDGIVVFSEIYYPDGWTATIDGRPAPIARADYVLRALYVPAGSHTIEMRFDPRSLHLTEGIAYGGLALLLVGALVLLGLTVRRMKKK